ncbi:UNVERIFIED_CONTAM: hypothetical protein Sindi_0375200 [Sesamum indicum]
MSDAKIQELGKRGKRKASGGEEEDGPSSFLLFSSSSGGKWRTAGGHTDDDETRREEEVEMAEAEEEEKQDPLGLFGSGIMTMILSKLDARSVALGRLVSRGWLAVASSDDIWAPKTRITRQDLCDHIWEFHFTEAAPGYWRNLDPYWNGTGPPMRRYFQPDGTITADDNDRVWGGHESCYTVVTGLLADGKIREHYMRINRWPKLSVHRKQDWGWELSNHLYCYTSVPDADKEDGTGPFFPASSILRNLAISGQECWISGYLTHAGTTGHLSDCGQLAASSLCTSQASQTWSSF